MSHGATARLFVALDPPREVREELAEWARLAAAATRRDAGGRAHRELRPLAPETLHLTLCFLGSRPVAEIDALAGALAPCADHHCELALGAPLWLPPREPRLLAVEVREESGELELMQRQLETALSRISGWEPARRRFMAHITVLRVRGRAPRMRRGGGRAGRGERAVEPAQAAAGAEQAPALPPTPSLRFAGEAITLYRSSLLPGGAAYEALASSALAPA